MRRPVHRDDGVGRFGYRSVLPRPSDANRAAALAGKHLWHRAIEAVEEQLDRRDIALDRFADERLGEGLTAGAAVVRPGGLQHRPAGEVRERGAAFGAPARVARLAFLKRTPTNGHCCLATVLQQRYSEGHQTPTAGILQV